MKDEMKREAKAEERRHFLGLLGGLGAAGFALPFLRVGEKRNELELKEAEFYHPHDLAG